MAWPNISYSYLLPWQNTIGLKINPAINMGIKYKTKEVPSQRYYVRHLPTNKRACLCGRKTKQIIIKQLYCCLLFSNYFSCILPYFVSEQKYIFYGPLQIDK